MKTLFLSLAACAFSLSVCAQTNSNGVYSTSSSRTTVAEKPASRSVIGGTVIHVNYDETTAINNTQKGAFEYACRLWEENIPTTLPLNITVKFGELANPDCWYLQPYYF